MSLSEKGPGDGYACIGPWLPTCCWAPSQSHIYSGVPMAKGLSNSPGPHLFPNLILWGKHKCLHFVCEETEAHRKKKKVICPETEILNDGPEVPTHTCLSSMVTLFSFPTLRNFILFLEDMIQRTWFLIQLNLHRYILDIRQNHVHQNTWKF